MFGRLGAVGGSNFVGLLLDTNCELIFYLYGVLILCKWPAAFISLNARARVGWHLRRPHFHFMEYTFHQFLFVAPSLYRISFALCNISLCDCVLLLEHEPNGKVDDTSASPS